MDRWDVLATLGVLLIAAGVWCVWPVGVLFWLGAAALLAGIAGAAPKRGG